MDPLINLLQKGLEGAEMRHRALLDNLANVNTPGYKRKDVDFLSTLKQEAQRNDQLKNSMKTTDDRHIMTAVEKEKPFKNLNIHNTSYRNDKNNVDIEYEMAELSKTELYYLTLAQHISNKFAVLNNVIEKGGK